jgi:hypothetical protein
MRRNHGGNHLPAIVAGASLLALGAGVLAGTPAVATGVSRTATPNQILDAARAATLTASSVTITVREQISGQPVSLTVSGRYPSYVRGVVLVADESEGIIVHGSTTYFEANAPIWQGAFKLSATAAATMANKWYSTSSTDPLLGGSTGSINPKTIERSVFTSMRDISAVKGLVIRATKIGGRAALELSDKDGAIYVAATGKPYLMRITSHNTTTTGFAEFSSYDAPVVATLPSIAGALDAAYSAALNPASSTTS